MQTVVIFDSGIVFSNAVDWTCYLCNLQHCYFVIPCVLKLSDGINFALNFP